MGVTAVLPMALALLWLGTSWFSVRGVVLPSWIVHDWMRRVDLSRYIQTSRALRVAKFLGFSLLALLVVALALGLLLAVMKSDPSLRSRFSAYEFQYGWIFSASYLHDWAPVFLCGLCLSTGSLLLGTVFFPFERGAHQVTGFSGASS